MIQHRYHEYHLFKGGEKYRYTSLREAMEAGRNAEDGATIETREINETWKNDDGVKVFVGRQERKHPIMVRTMERTATSWCWRLPRGVS